jgi:hypothetical protein
MRWDWRNGIPLCLKCHEEVTNMKLSTIHKIMLKAPHEYLDYFNSYPTSADYFAEAGITKADWYKMQLEENKRKAGGV